MPVLTEFFPLNSILSFYDMEELVFISKRKLQELEKNFLTYQNEIRMLKKELQLNR